MKPAHPLFRHLIILAAAVIMLGLAAGARAQDPAPLGENFPGVKKALTPEQFAAAGLDKLSPEERAKLDEYLRGYVEGATQRVAQQAASHAVDRAVKERKVEPPQLIETRIVGRVDGWKIDKIFIMENGQHWKVTENGNRYFAPLDNPSVFIVKEGILGYKMAVAGGGVVRVRRLQ